MTEEDLIPKRQEGQPDNEVMCRHSNGTLFPVEVSRGKLHTENGELVISIVRDISERKHFEKVLVDQLTHDALTGLPNRLRIIEKLREAIIHARLTGTGLAVLFLDVDFFKKIDDTFGHAHGNEVLRECVLRLTQVLHQGDTLARQGGDEFIIMEKDIDRRQDAVTLAERLLQRIREPFYIEGHEVFLSASLGITMFPDDEQTEDGLLHKAHVAMNCAKKNRRDSYRFYAPEMDQGIRERLEMESYLRHAVGRGELLLHYQPKMSLRSGAMAGMEALMRWHHPVLGMVAPDRFIALAEESGLIEPIGMWVLKEACS